MRAKRLSRLISVIISAVMLVTAIMPTLSYSVGIIDYPDPFQEFRYGESVTVRWSPPSGYTVDHYTFSLRRWHYDDQLKIFVDELLYDRMPLSSSVQSFTIPDYAIIKKINSEFLYAP